MTPAAVESLPISSSQTSTRELAAEVAGLLLARGWMMTTAESCTGGLLAGACTDLPGSSQWFERGLVTYSNRAKTELLGVDAELLAVHGAVSEPVARAMAQGALARPGGGVCAQASVAVTGVAGPAGGTPATPVGTVWLAWCVEGEVSAERQCFAGDRAAVRAAIVQHALRRLAECLRAASAAGLTLASAPIAPVSPR